MPPIWFKSGAPAIPGWRTIAVSDDFTNMAAVACEEPYGSGNGKIFMSTNSGVSWTEIYVGATIWGISGSKDLSSLVITERGSGSIKKSTDMGQTWSELTAAGSRDWRDIHASEDFLSMVAAEWNGLLWITRNGGISWSSLTSTSNTATSAPAQLVHPIANTDFSRIAVATFNQGILHLLIVV